MVKYNGDNIAFSAQQSQEILRKYLEYILLLPDIVQSAVKICKCKGIEGNNILLISTTQQSPKIAKSNTQTVKPIKNMPALKKIPPDSPAEKVLVMSADNFV
jgi:hypothetical protein